MGFRDLKRRMSGNPGDFNIDECEKVCLWYYETRINGRISVRYRAGFPGVNKRLRDMQKKHRKGGKCRNR